MFFPKLRKHGVLLQRRPAGEEQEAITLHVECQREFSVASVTTNTQNLQTV